MDKAEIAKGLSEEEREALVIALNATYRPGVVAAQTHFHGKRNQKGEAAADMLAGLASGPYPLLRFLTQGGDHYVGTRSVEYGLTDLGREVAALLRLPAPPQKGEGT